MESRDAEVKKGKAFCDLLESLRKEHRDWVRKPKRDKLQKLSQRVMDETGFRVVEEMTLKQLAAEVASKSGHLKLGAEGALFLHPPPKKMFLPVLGMSGNLEDGCLRVEMALFTFTESTSDAKLAAVGFRFETPEEKGDKHIYHHAQMIRRFEKSCSYELPCLPPWFPDTLPALPLSARTPFSLFLTIMVSLYGLSHLARQWEGQRFFEYFLEDVNDLKGGCGHF